jgi:hypothetical protein
VSCPVSARGRGRSEKTRKEDLEEGAVEELLFGWFEGKTEKEEDRDKISVLPNLPSPFYLFNPIIFLSR